MIQMQCNVLLIHHESIKFQIKYIKEEKHNYFMENQGIGISHLPNQRYRSFCKNGIDYNIMIVGGRGSGKTTFMNMILDVDLLNNNPFDGNNQKQNYNIKLKEAKSPYKIIDKKIEFSEICKLKSLVNFQITETKFIDKNFNVRLSITEVDGVGDRINNYGCWEPITSHINDMFSDYHLEEKKSVKSLIKDRRIHVCLYFIDSTLSPIRKIDLRVMKEISQHCNLIPIVSRSDSLTESEVEYYYTTIRETILKEGISFCDPRSSKSLRTITNNSPFFIVSSCLKSKNLKERKLIYGDIYLDSAMFGDLVELKRILIEENMLDLIESTEYYYEIHRAECMTKQLFEEGGWSEEETNLMKEFAQRFKEANEEYSKKRTDFLIQKSISGKKTENEEEQISPNNTPKSVQSVSKPQMVKSGSQSAK